jgi:RNA polymerase sigma factor (sigma-70 family)
MGSNLEQYVRHAKNGDRQALEKLVCHIQDKIFGLALRMLNDPQDAEDEAQEILIKVITHLSDFREESAFSSWVYRIACNHLLTMRNRRSERTQMTFDFLKEMSSAPSENSHHLTVSGPERDVLLEEVRLGCMQGVLSCLEKEMRIVFILGDLFGVTSQEGAFILGISPEAFRKRLSRGRKLMQNFMMKHCGLVDKNNACRCHKNASIYLEQDQDLANLGKKFIVKKEAAAKSRAEAVAHLKELSEIDRTVAMYRRYPEYQSPESFVNIAKDLINSRKYSIFFNNAYTEKSVDGI